MRSSTASDNWEHALISGNGVQGALLYGRPGTGRVTLSHERLFLPVDEPLAAPQTAPALDELRAAVLAGDGERAARRVVQLARAEDPRYASLRRIDPLVGAGTLTLTGLPAGGYARGVDYATGVAWQRSGGLTQELFVSRADDVVVLRLRRIGGAVRARLWLHGLADQPPVPVLLRASARPGWLRLAGTFPGAWPGAVRGYTVTARVLADGAPAGGRPGGGWLAGSRAGGRRAVLRVGSVREVLVLLRTSVACCAGDEAAELAEAELAELPADWDWLLAAHTRLHRPLIDACSLRLHTPNTVDALGDSSSAPTSEELLAEPASPGLVQELFQAGRYAIISSTGTLPPTLQGVWSGSYHPAWQSGYTLDGNLFTALAGLAPTGTPELLRPLFDLLDAHREAFAENARRLYGARGVLLPPHLSTHGRHNHFDATWCLTFFTAGAAWATRLYAEYFAHTGDTDWWRARGFPFLESARDFLRDYAPEGQFAPSYSPENTPAGTGSQAAVNATLDVAAYRALRADLGEAPVGPGYTVAADGTLDEWLWPGLAPNHAHRHASHLLPVWYPDPLLFTDPALVAAARATVRARLAWWRGNGDEMAFGLAGLGLAAAQLGMADECREILALLSGYWRPSLVATHNRGAIFNVDSCGGLPAMVVRMLLRHWPAASGECRPFDGGWPGGRLDLLPALPTEWSQGELRGAALGALRVPRLAWEPGRITVSLYAREATTVQLGVPAGFQKPGPIELTARQVVDVCLVSRKTNSHAIPPAPGGP